MSKWSKCWTQGTPEKPWSGLQGHSKLKLAKEIVDALDERVRYARRFYDLSTNEWEPPEQGMLLRCNKRYWVDYPLHWYEGRIPENTDFVDAISENVNFHTTLPSTSLGARQDYAIILPVSFEAGGYGQYYEYLRQIYKGFFNGIYLDDYARTIYSTYCFVNSIQFFADLRELSFSPNPPYQWIAPVYEPSFEYKDPLPAI